MKKNIVSIMVLSMVTAFTFMAAGCSAKQTSQPAEKEAGSTEQTQASSGENSEENVKIGLMLQLSGSNPAVSKEDLLGCQIIADIINNETDYNLPLAKTVGLPNLNGAKVEIVVGDVATNDAAMSECERLITEEGVSAFAGVIGSSGVKIAATAFEKYGVPYVANASSPSLTSSGYEYLVRIFPDDRIYCEGVFEFIKELNETENAGIKTVALCSEDSEFGANITAIEEELTAEYGLELVKTVKYSATATNVTSEVLQLKDANSDVVMMSSYTSDAILFMQTFKEQNYMPKLLCAQRGGFSYNEIFDSLGKDMDYVYNSSPWASDLSVPNTKLLRELFAKESGGAELQEGCARIMTDFYAACLAINQAGTTDATAIMEEFRKGIDIPDDQKWLSIDIKIDETGQNLESSVLVMQALDGSYKTVYPGDVASAKYIYPVPGWDKR